MSEYPPSKVCQILEIPTSTYYYEKNTAKSTKEKEAETIAVIETFREHMGNFGRRTIHKLLLLKNINISDQKISKILKENGLTAKYGRKKCTNVHTSEQVSEKYISENLYAMLNNQEKSKEIWSMDFTEQKVSGKRIYTCGIISVNGKQLVGKTTGYKNNSETACRTLQKAIEKFGVPYMVMTDRGSPFVSKNFYDIIERNGIKHSMSRPGTPVDNRFIETFWKSMKVEIGPVKHLTVKQYKMVLDYYEYYYNFLRPHSTLGYCAPMTHLLKTVI